MYQYNNSKLKETLLSDTMTFNDMNEMLNHETEKNKSRNWIGLNYSTKIEKLNIYAEFYGKQNNYDEKLIESLKRFLIEECLNKSKLKNTKDIYYNKESKEITNIPLLKYNSLKHNFTLKNTDLSQTLNKKTIRNIHPKNNIIIKNKKLIDIKTNELSSLKSTPDVDEKQNIDILLKPSSDVDEKQNIDILLKPSSDVDVN
jgi:hypothetical protein